MIELNWDDFYNVVPEFGDEGMKLGTLHIPLDETIDFGAQIGKVPARGLAHLTNPQSIIEGWPFTPQLAMLVFVITRRASVLNTYFPLTKILDKAEQKDFYHLAGEIMSQPDFKVTLVTWHEGGRMGVLNAENAWNEETLINAVPGLALDSVSHHAAEIAFFVACHVAETFFYERRMLKALVHTPLEIRLATSAEAFKQDGGAAGGNFHADKRAIQLVLSRLFEGFNGKTPGVAPFLHEFGHLLDHFTPSKRRLSSSSHGTLPGMRPSENHLFNSQALKLFIKGKELELERYTRQYEHGYREGDILPIGHPYVFQNNGEFIAGYFEMFFRNPHTFAEQNFHLYESFRRVFGYDPRKAWTADFPYYIEQNQQFYREHKPPKPGITIPRPRPDVFTTFAEKDDT